MFNNQTIKQYVKLKQRSLQFSHTNEPYNIRVSKRLENSIGQYIILKDSFS